MKFATLFSFPFICLLSIMVWPPDTKSSPTNAAPARELTDIPGIVFARNLLDWRNRPIDSAQMDLYYPTGATANRKYPLILFCHAGGFSGGNRFNVMAICDRFADQGFAVAGIDYRVGYKKGKGDAACETDSVSLNEAIYRASQDANAAFRYLVANAEKLNIDTNWIFIAGSSAGGSLALVDTYLNDSTAQIYYPYIPPKLGGLQSSGNAYTNKYTIKGIVSMWGALSYADGLIDAKYTSVPTILFKGTEEGGIPDSVGHYRECQTLPVLYAGIAIYEKLRSENTHAVFHTLPLANHPAYDVEFCVEQSTCFLKAIMAGRPYSGQYTYFDPSCR